MITHFDGGDTFPNGFNDATAFVAQDGREIPFGIGAGQRVGVRVTDTGGNDTHQHLPFLGWSNVHFHNFQRFVGGKRHRGTGFNHWQTP